MTEAYRRAFAGDLQREAEKLAEKAERQLEDWRDFLPTNKALSARARTVLESEWVVMFMDEQEKEPGEVAREVLVEKAQFEGDRRAAEIIIDQEDKLGFRDAQEKWAEIMCAIGAEVVVPLPGGEEVVVPLKSMFPKYEDALPPPEVIEKSIKALDQHLWVKNHPNPESADIKADWEYGYGMNGVYPEPVEETDE